MGYMVIIESLPSCTHIVDETLNSFIIIFYLFRLDDSELSRDMTLPEESFSEETLE